MEKLEVADSLRGYINRNGNVPNDLLFADKINEIIDWINSQEREK